jgi:hypothetical protein
MSVHGSVGLAAVAVDDVWIDATHGVRAGHDAALRLSLTDDSSRPDALVGVTAPFARSADRRCACSGSDATCSPVSGWT